MSAVHAGSIDPRPVQLPENAVLGMIGEIVRVERRVYRKREGWVADAGSGMRR